jgi:cytochrome b6-f complex iron-sulfur subunit
MMTNTQVVTKTRMNRREFLAWATAGAAAVFGVAGAAAMVLPDPKTDPLLQDILGKDAAGQQVRPFVGGFTYPRIKEGTFGGQFIVDRKADSYTLDEKPELNAAGKFYVVKAPALTPVEDGGVAGDEQTNIMAVYQVCTHLGCLVPFDSGQNRFICPCHGSTFERNSDYVLGPAPRSLDQFEVSVTPDGVITVDTGKKRTGKFHA